MFKLVTFGEIMLRLSPPRGERLFQGGALETCFGGSEANVAALCARLGLRAAYVTKVPDGELGDAALRSLAYHGVDTSASARGGERLGVYYYEHGAGLRPGKCVYDRAHSAFAGAKADEFDFDAILSDANALFLSGITPALSAEARAACLAACEAAKRRGATVYFDLNYRSKLWSEDEARTALGALLPSVDVLISNLYQANDILALGVDTSDEEAACRSAARALVDRCSLRAAALTVRRTFSADRNSFFAMLYDGENAYFSAKHDTAVVDRVGSGDAFSAALIAELAKGRDPQSAVEYAAAAAALAHSVKGDAAILSDAEIRALAEGGEARTVR